MGHLLASLAALVGCTNPPLTGTLTDGLSGAPIAGDPAAADALKIMAKGKADASVACTRFDAVVQADGTFTFDGICASNTAYSLSLTEGTLWLADHGSIAEGTAGPLALQAWRAPVGTGIFKLVAGELTALKTVAEVKNNKVLGTQEPVRSPDSIPGKPTLIAGDDLLVVSGKDALGGYQFIPLIPSDKRKFDDPADPAVVEPWSYVGIRFMSDTEFERVNVEMDESKTIVKQGAERNAKYIKADALPPGRYAILKEKDRRMFIVDFGAHPPEPAAEEPGKDGKAGKAGKAP